MSRTKATFKSVITGAALGIGFSSAMLFSAVALRADTIRGCVMFDCGNAASGSWPALATGDLAWRPFDRSVAIAAAGKRMAVQYLPTTGDENLFPLQTQPSTLVQLTVGAAAPVTCSTPPPSPIPPLASGGTPSCWYRLEQRDYDIAGPASTQPIDTVRLYHQGPFGVGGSIRWTIANLLADPGNTVEAFDSNNPRNVFTGASLGAAAPSASTSRQPARLVLVFDKSGSLDWSARPEDVTCGSYMSPTFNCRRWNILENAAEQLVSVAKAFHLPGDELGVVLFDSTATVAGGGFSPMDTATLNGVGATLGATGPGGSTSLGAGVVAMQAALESQNASFNNMILIFTDGEQNRAPYLRASVAGLLINPTSPIDLGAAFPSAGNAWRTCVFWLRTDDPAAPEMTSLNQRISDNGCTLLADGVAPRNAVSTIDASSTELVEYFLGILQATLIGDKLEFVHTSRGVLPGPTDRADVAFKSSDQDVALTLLVNWPLGRDNPRDIALEKDGLVFDPRRMPGAEVSNGTAHVAITLRPPFCNTVGECVEPGGDWRLTFGNDGSTSDPYAYGLFVMADNRNLASSFRVEQPVAGVGQKLTFEARLTEGGAPVAGLPDGAVRAIVSGPDAGLGNVLSEAKVPPASVDMNDLLSASGLKTLAMRGDPALAAQLAAALGQGAAQTVTLTEVDPGLYTGDFSATGAEGVYQVRFEVDGETTGNGAFARVWTTDRYVAVVPDRSATVMDAQAYGCDLPGQCFILTLKPADLAGNLVGPGKTTLIAANDFGGTVLSDITDNLDGTYTIRVGYGDDDRQPPVVDVDGAKIPFPPVDSWTGARSGWDLAYGPNWWMILLAILLALALIIAWALRRNAP